MDWNAALCSVMEFFEESALSIWQADGLQDALEGIPVN